METSEETEDNGPRPTQGRKAKDGIDERKVDEEARTQAIVDRAIANGTARAAYGEVKTRRVDPAVLKREAAEARERREGRPPAASPPAGRPPTNPAARRPPSSPQPAPAPAPQPARPPEPKVEPREPAPGPTGGGVKHYADKECAREGCDVVFTPEGPRQKFCTPRCRENQHPKPELDERECQWEECTISFVPEQANQRYHSPGCRVAAERKQKRDSKKQHLQEAKAQEEAEAALRATAEAASSEVEPEVEKLAAGPAETPNELRAHYVELLFAIAEEQGGDPTLRGDALSRLERIVMAGR